LLKLFNRFTTIVQYTLRPLCFYELYVTTVVWTTFRKLDINLNELNCNLICNSTEKKNCHQQHLSKNGGSVPRKTV